MPAGTLETLPSIKAGTFEGGLDTKKIDLVLLAEVEFNPKAFQFEYVFERTIPSSGDNFFIHSRSERISARLGRRVQVPVYVCGTFESDGTDYLYFVREVYPKGDNPDPKMLSTGDLEFDRVFAVLLSEVVGYKSIKRLNK